MLGKEEKKEKKLEKKIRKKNKTKQKKEIENGTFGSEMCNLDTN